MGVKSSLCKTLLISEANTRSSASQRQQHETQLLASTQKRQELLFRTRRHRMLNCEVKCKPNKAIHASIKKGRSSSVRTRGSDGVMSWGWGVTNENRMGGERLVGIRDRGMLNTLVKWPQGKLTDGLADEAVWVLCWVMRTTAFLEMWVRRTVNAL